MAGNLARRFAFRRNRNSAANSAERREKRDKNACQRKTERFFISAAFCFWAAFTIASSSFIRHAFLSSERKREKFK